MTASKPASATTSAISRASVATTSRSHTPSSAMRRVTVMMRGSLPSGRSGLRGSRLEPSRAGITPRTGTEEDTKSVPLSLARPRCLVLLPLPHVPFTDVFRAPKAPRIASSSYFAGRPDDTEEVLENAFPMLRPDGLGMELHAVSRVIPMFHGHDLCGIAWTLAVGAHGGDDERGGERGGIDHERVVAHRGKRTRNPVEQLVVAMHDGTGLAVHQAGRADDLPAERLTDRLVAEAHAQHRHPAGERPNQGDQDARLRGRLGTWREHRGGGFQRLHLGDAQRVVPIDNGILSQLAEILHEVVGERIVVVEDEEHGGILTQLVRLNHGMPAGILKRVGLRTHHKPEGDTSC